MNDHLQGISGEEHGPRREIAAFTTSIDCQRAEGRVPVAANSGGGPRASACKALANTKSSPPEEKSDCLVTSVAAT